MYARNPVCHWCGCRVRSERKKGNRATLDHVYPVSLGGTHTADNFVLSCPGCNINKGNREPSEWLRYLESVALQLRSALMLQPDPITKAVHP